MCLFVNVGSSAGHERPISRISPWSTHVLAQPVSEPTVPPVLHFPVVLVNFIDIGTVGRGKQI